MLVSLITASAPAHPSIIGSTTTLAHNMRENGYMAELNTSVENGRLLVDLVCNGMEADVPEHVVSTMMVNTWATGILRAGGTVAVDHAEFI